MGTTRSFLFLKNKGDSTEALREKLRRYAVEDGEVQDRKMEFLRALLKRSEETLPRREGNVIQFPGTQPDWADILISQMSAFSRYNVIAYRPDVPWLPYFNTSLCDGNITRSEELQSAAEVFETSVLALAVYDSDILCVSYYDVETKQGYDYIKSNLNCFDEFDEDTYLDEFPEFLLDLCGRDQAKRLRELWEEPLSFADDRMVNLAFLLGTRPLYDETLQQMEGFEKLSAE